MSSLNEALKDYYVETFGEEWWDERQGQVERLRIHMGGPANNPVEVFGTDRSSRCGGGSHECKYS